MNIEHKRQGQMDIAICYFYTDTIYEFKHLLKSDALKMVCINSWKYLVDNNLIKIYGYVIMPNHIHLLWKMLSLNGKESPAGSFAKFTAHQFKKILGFNEPLLLQQYSSSKSDRAYQFWKRDPLAIPLTSEKNLLQKLDYIHNNPVKEKWQLADVPENYRWSSAGFYAGKPDEFGILTHHAE
jgi:putative transposase